MEILSQQPECLLWERSGIEGYIDRCLRKRDCHTRRGNGAGKTTLMMTISGIIKRDLEALNSWVGGLMGKAYKLFGWVLPKYLRREIFFPNMTVMENLGSGPILRKRRSILKRS
jgi:ABC-type branched-subunit amino acid transport system ATPase component